MSLQLDLRVERTGFVLDVSLTVDPGEVVALLGPNGAGKTTVLRAVAGLQPLTSGSVVLDGVALQDLPPEERRVGLVPQDGLLLPHLSARDNVGLLAKYLGWEKSRVDQRIGELAELTRLPLEALGRYPTQLSGGQRQRLGIMRALMLDPRVLLLDEPLGALDPMIRRELQVDLKDIFDRLGKTVVLVTHDMGEAVFLASRVVLLREGRVVQDGTPADVLHRPADAFVADFLSAQRSPTEALGGAA